MIGLGFCANLLLSDSPTGTQQAFASEKNPPVEASQVSPPTISQIINNYVQAIGGRAALAGVKTLVRSGRQQSGSAEVPVTLYAQAPHQWLEVRRHPNGEVTRHGSDGSGGWILNHGGLNKMSRDQWLAESSLYDFQAVVDLPAAYPQMLYKGSEKQGARSVHVIEAASAAGDKQTLYFDATTGLLVRIGIVALEDYREVEGIKVPFLFDIVGYGQTYKFTNALVNVALDKVRFDIPYEKTQVLIPMRDGVRLNTEILTPTACRQPLPFLFSRTLYGIEHMSGRLAGQLQELADDQYIFVFQDIRGYAKSEGKLFPSPFPLRENKRDPRCLDESTDAYDTIEWLVGHVAQNNGRVGMLGSSYLAWLGMAALLDPHPALKALCAEASPADQFLGDDFHHNGAFRLSSGFEILKLGARFTFDRYDTYEWYLKEGVFSQLTSKYFTDQQATWKCFFEHPNYDFFWQKQSLISALAQVEELRIPVLNVAGWYDQEDFSGPMKVYELLEKKDPRGLNNLVVGP